MERDRHLDEARAAGAAAAQLRNGTRAKIGSAAGSLTAAQVQRLATVSPPKAASPESSAADVEHPPLLSRAQKPASAVNLAFPTERLTELVSLTGRTRAQVARQFADLVEKHGRSVAADMLDRALEFARARPAPPPMEPRRVDPQGADPWKEAVIPAEPPKAGSEGQEVPAAESLPPDERSNILSPAIRRAQALSGEPTSAVAVWAVLQRLAIEKVAPFYGTEEAGLQYLSSDDRPLVFSLKNLRDRLHRQSVKAARQGAAKRDKAR